MSQDTEGQEFQRFLAEVKRRFRPTKVVLFGSRAGDQYSSRSDYDLLIVADSFEGVPLTDRATAIYRMWPLPTDLDCLCLTPREFERSRKGVTIVRQIDRGGVLL